MTSDPARAPAAVILAAGASRRMGANKMLLRLAGETLVRRTVQMAHRAHLTPIIVVLGRDADLVQAELDGLPCTFVLNPEYTGPTSGSLHRGLEQLPETTEAAVVLLADMVQVTEPMLEQLVIRATQHPAAPLVVSRYGDVTAPPLLFRRALFPELLAWHGEGCGKKVVQDHREEAEVLDWPATALADVDTPEDAARVGVALP